ncbi:serine/threonine-protein kinase PLK4 [Arapaima gigas]
MSVSIGSKIEDFKVLTLLGKGSFACVYKAKSVNTGLEVAIKMIDKKAMHKAGMVQRVSNEVEIHCRLKHPSILELYSYFEDSNYVYLVLEMCHNGEMSRYLKNRKKPFREDEVRNFMHQIVKGLLYLHTHGIMHRDLTLSNLLLTSNKNIKIADFGLATQLKLPTEKHFTMCGTPNYISPEVATRSAHGLESDVWSLGCMFYAFLVGHPPFDTTTVKHTLNKVVLGEYEMPTHVSHEAQDLIQLLLRKNPAERPSLSSVLDHPFMTGCLSIRGTELGGLERSVDSGFATVSALSTTSSSSSYFYRKARNVIRSTLPHRMVAPPTLTHQRIDSAFEDRGQQQESKALVTYGKPETTQRSDDGRPHSRYLRRVHSSDQLDSSVSTFPIIEEGGFERCCPPEVLQGMRSSTSSRAEPKHQTSLPAKLDAISKSSAPTHQLLSLTRCGSEDSPCWITEGCFHQPTDASSHVANSSCLGGQDVRSQARPCPPASHNKNYQPLPKEDLLPQGDMTSAVQQKQLLKNMLQPLSSARLKPIRQKTKNAVVSILETGEVCLELLQCQGFPERVKEVLRISSDGSTVTIYQPSDGKAPPLLQCPPSPPENIFICSYEDLPEKYWKKYHYAIKFVQLVKSKTPKVTLYTKYAKCMLMENSPNADVEVSFYDGTKIHRSSELVRIVEKTGKSLMMKGDVELSGLSPETKAYMELFNEGHHMCLALEAAISAEEQRSSRTTSFFPITIGRRPINPSFSGPTSWITHAWKLPPVAADAPLQTTNIIPSMMSYNGSDYTSGTLTKSSTPLSASQESSAIAGKVLKSVFVPKIGWASQLTNGEVWVQFNDGSQLVVQAGGTSIHYISPEGHTSRYQENEKLPQHVKEKLQCLSSILGLLASPSGQH